MSDRAKGPLLAEWRGFEPPNRFYPINRLAGGCHRPLGHHSVMRLAEGVGFEPTELSLSGFQDRRLKPLGHPSAISHRRRRNIGRRAAALNHGTARRDIRLASALPPKSSGRARYPRKPHVASQLMIAGFRAHLFCQVRAERGASPGGMRNGPGSRAQAGPQRYSMSESALFGAHRRIDREV